MHDAPVFVRQMGPGQNLTAFGKRPIHRLLGGDRCHLLPLLTFPGTAAAIGTNGRARNTAYDDPGSACPRQLAADHRPGRTADECPGVGASGTPSQNHTCSSHGQLQPQSSLIHSVPSQTPRRR